MVQKRVSWVVSACLLGGCVGGGLAPTVWPPANFSLVVDETSSANARLDVVRRLYVDASGVVVYGTSSEPLVDAQTGASLPVFDRLCIYRLEPKSVRALARKIDRLGIGELLIEAPAEGGEGAGLAIAWRAFDEQRLLTTVGRVRGDVAEILGVVAAHLPPGEAFDTQLKRPVVPVLRGVPEPGAGAAAALEAYREQLDERPEDPVLLLDAFALACRRGDREGAEQLLGRWREAALAQGGDSAFATDPGAAPRARAEIYARMLPGAAEAVSSSERR